MSKPYKLKKTIGSDYNTDIDDVWVTKQNLKNNGFYDEPKYGMTPYTDQKLIDSIKEFQKSRNLHVDGVMKPEGETEQELLKNAASPTYICSICGAPHGGVSSPNICWQCWNKGFR